MDQLKAPGIEAISAIPADFPLAPKQIIIRDATASGKPYVAADVARLLRPFGPPAYYLDGEIFAYLRACLTTLARVFNVSNWRIAAAERSPKIVPAASAVRGIGTIRDRVIFETAPLTLKGSKQQKTLAAQGVLACLIILEICTRSYAFW